MIERIEKLYQWLSPSCLAVAAGMVYSGSGALDPIMRGWTAAAFWGVCGGFAMSGLIFALLALYAGQQHVRVARARILKHRRQLSARRRAPASHDHTVNS